ncbi:OmpA family protein [Aliikangiella marina]|uniref:OmpA family protein n=1 Tax=Aliikangiella marina TaxID=1712262 RepID=A0A545T6P6_9GAMM|nr:OmpA family protein [Aliikangiella marina]TQV72893.1 OmpA family protein [Aliikangiella marina]
MSKWITSVVLKFFVGVIFFVSPQVDAAEPASDIDFIGRYPGSVMSAFAESEFDSVKIPLSVNEYKKAENFQSITVEGRRSVRIYDVPNETSTLKVFRSLEKGLQAAGFETKLSCNGENNGCGYFFLRSLMSKQAIESYYKYKFKEFYNLNTGKLHIFSGKRLKDGKNYYLVMVVAQSKYARVMQYSLDLVEVQPLKTESLIVTVSKMTKDIGESGKVVLDGLYFENDSAALTDVSGPALKIIAEYLNAHKALKFLVVGHTDTKGSYNYNQRLSQQRAQSVIKALVDNYKVNAESLKGIGIAFASPKATNNTKSGRSQNRRVELVQVEAF